MLIVADFGSSFVKFSAIDEKTGKVFDSQKERTVSVIQDGIRCECDANMFFESLKRYIDREALAHPIDAVLISSQMHGFILKRNDAFGSYISWQDKRSMHDAFHTLDALKADIPSRVIMRSGMRIKPEMALCNLRSLLSDEAVLKLSESEDAFEIFTLGSYVTYMLTGKNVTHASAAVPMGIFDAETGKPNEELLSLCGLCGLKLPEVLPFGVAGYYGSIPIYTEIGDHTAVLAGADVSTGAVNMNMGTTSQVSCLADGFSEDFYTKSYELRPYFDGRLVKVATKLQGGRSLQVLIDFFAETAEALTGTRPETSAVWEYADALMLDLDTSLEVKTGFFDTLLFPEGCIDGIRDGNLSIKTIMSAAYRDIARTFLRMADELSPNYDTVYISGKFAPIMKPILEKLSAREINFIAGDGDEITRGVVSLYWNDRKERNGQI